MNPLRIDVESAAAHLLPFAKKKLEELRGLDIQSRYITASTGETIYVQKGEVDLIRIRGGAEYPFVTNAIGGGFNPYSPVTGTYGAGSYAIGVSGGRVSVRPRPATDTLVDFKIEAVGRALKLPTLDNAEGLLRQMTTLFGILPAFNDSALLVDGELLVDPAAFPSAFTAAQVERLTALCAPFLSTFTHNPPQPEVAELLDESEDTTIYPHPDTGVVGVHSADGISYEFMWEDGTPLTDVTLAPATPLLSFSTDYMKPAGSRIICTQRMMINSSTLDITDYGFSLTNNHRHERGVFVYRLRTLVNTFSLFSTTQQLSGLPVPPYNATLITAPFSSSYAPQIGSGVATAVLYDLRRYASGWALVAQETLTRQPLLTFSGTADSSAAPVYSVAPATEATEHIHLRYGGSYATRIHYGADVIWTSIPTRFSNSGDYFRRPGASGAVTPLLGTYTSDPVTLHFTTTNGTHRFEQTVRGQFRVIAITESGVETTVYADIPASGLAPTAATAPISYEYNYSFSEVPKTGSGTPAEYATFLSTFYITGSSSYYIPRLEASAAHCPFGISSQNVAVLYQPRTGRFILVKRLAASGAYSTAHDTYVTALRTGSEAERVAAYNALRAMVSIELNTGLDESLFWLASILAVGGSGNCTVLL
jgi:hypothetical protein